MPRSKFPRPMSGRSFPAILKQPIDRPNELAVALTIYGLPETVRTKARKFVADYEKQQVEERLEALKIHYGLSLPPRGIQMGQSQKPMPPVSDRQLMLNIAEDFIIGFRSVQEGLQTKAGRKKGTTKDKSAELMKAIWECTDKGHTVLNACRLLTKDKNSKWFGVGELKLKSRYDRVWNQYRSAASNGPDPFFEALKNCGDDQT